MVKTDVLIIGAGVTGLSCARHLEKAGRRGYILLERQNKIGGLADRLKFLIIYETSSKIVIFGNLPWKKSMC